MKIYKICGGLLLILLMGFVYKVDAQTRVINVVSGFGTLNDAIDGDTTATGERNDPENTVYVLERDGFYLLNGSIENSGWPLRIEAAEGSGARPVLQPGVVTGGESARPFRPRGDFYIKGLYVTNQDELGLILLRTIRVSADSVKVVVDDCHIDYSSQSAFRIDNDFNKIYITNSIISNIGRMTSPNNGRGIDDRGNPIDTLVMENNTFYNITSRILRDGGGIINYAKINHNTLVNVGQMGCSIGEAIEVTFTNNLFINTSFFGRAPESTWSSFEVSPLIEEGINQVVNFSNNNFYTHPDLIAAQPDSVNAAPIINEMTDTLFMDLGISFTNLNEAIEFTTGPTLPTNIVTDNWDVTNEDTTDMDNGGAGPVPQQGVPVQLAFDFAYPMSAASYTASTAGQPLGALTWFGIDIISSVEQISSEVPKGFKLTANYPNPFNPSTTFEYALPNEADVALTIYNSVGQEIATVISKVQPAGVYQARWDGVNNFGATVSSGIYFYQLRAGNFTATKKMMLLK